MSSNRISMASIQKKVFVLTIMFLAIYLSWATTSDNYNVLLIAFMSLMPLIWLLIAKLKKQDLVLLVLSLLLALNPLVMAAESYRISTILYSMMFFGLFVTYRVILNTGRIDLFDYKNVLKLVIYCYFITLVIQQFSVLLGLPIFNESAYYLKSPWKLNSLASEPAVAGKVLSVLMFSFVLMNKYDNRYPLESKSFKSENRFVWVAFTWCMLSMGSGTAVLFFLPVLLVAISSQRASVVGGLVALIFPLLLFSGLLDRPILFLQSLASGDIESMLAVDASAALRILPQFIIATNVEFFSLSGLFGQGVDYSGKILHELLPMLEEGTAGGGMFQIWLEYGFIAFVIFSAYSFSVCVSRAHKLSAFFWFMLVFMYGINNSIVWLTIVLLSTNKYFIQRHINSSPTLN